MALPVILIFDVGKTHKKILLFNQGYELVQEESYRFSERTDEDGFPCEDISLLTDWLISSCARILSDDRYELRAINFSAYGASLVYLSEEGPTLPLYNYLKPYPASIQHLFLKDYGPSALLSRQTASPFLGSLNSGLQMYRIKAEKPEDYHKIKYALHLPQYLSYVLTGQCCSDLSSIGCHTMLWDFQAMQYHSWTRQEGIPKKLAPVKGSNVIAGFYNDSIPVGVGLHDSSAALAPYLHSFKEPFILISTGTWCISLNPFNDRPLTDYELDNDTLFYLSYQGKPVKASRIFAGNEHEEQVSRLGQFFDKPAGYYRSVVFDPAIPLEINEWIPSTAPQNHIKQSVFPVRDLNTFPDFETAYHQLISDIVRQQEFSTRLIWQGAERSLFADGGFSQNDIYMHLLAAAFPGINVYSAVVPQASALGAALAMHTSWNEAQIPDDLVSLISYR